MKPIVTLSALADKDIQHMEVKLTCGTRCYVDFTEDTAEAKWFDFNGDLDQLNDQYWLTWMYELFGGSWVVLETWHAGNGHYGVKLKRL